jgi:endogenous inhibitor of DNA gyrase (YacG/DUF329 family)
MKELNEITVVCPICKKEHSAKAHRVVDVNREEDIQKKLDDDSLFAFDCPDCGCTVQLNYSFLYQDADIREYIYMSEEKPAEDAASIDQIARSAMALADGKTEDALLRIVYSRRDLKEKIAVFAHGLDDRIVEICKGIALSQLPATEDFFATDIRYRDIGGKEVLAIKVSDGTEQYVLDFSGMYGQMYAEYGSLLPPLRSHVFSCVDLEFAAAFLRGLDES